MSVFQKDIGDMDEPEEPEEQLTGHLIVKNSLADLFLLGFDKDEIIELLTEELYDLMNVREDEKPETDKMDTVLALLDEFQPQEYRIDTKGSLAAFYKKYRGLFWEQEVENNRGPCCTHTSLVSRLQSCSSS